MTNVSGAKDELPCWNLADLYPAPDSAELQADLEAMADDAEAFAARCRGRIAEMTEDEFAEEISAYERLGDVMGRVLSYAQLWYAENVNDPERGRFFQGMQEHMTLVMSELAFFPLEINRLDDAVLEAKCGAAA
ncbi:MAG: oligoendopeptidase F [Rhodospirillaceae bacterium]|nr:MAG: oligoendopeptidase F [Rhodospirillaceae bacterium]